MSKIEKVTSNHCGRSLASDEVCSEKTGVNATKISAEFAMKSTGFREKVGHDCYHICFPKSYCVGKHVLLALSAGG